MHIADAVTIFRQALQAVENSPMFQVSAWSNLRPLLSTEPSRSSLATP